MVELAYSNDPRLLRQKAKELAEKEAAKQAKKDAKAKYYEEIQERERKEEEAKQALIDAEKEKERKAAQDLKDAGKKLRESYKEIIVYCSTKLPSDTKYDRFYLGERLKLFKVQETCDAFFDKLKKVDDAQF